jgi:hypothetical protein
MYIYVYVYIYIYIYTYEYINMNTFIFIHVYIWLNSHRGINVDHEINVINTQNHEISANTVYNICSYFVVLSIDPH